jgi:16S rRNA (cytidine1402-2'-O)-methyltransferase
MPEHYNWSRHMPGTLFVVGTPIGNLEDITLRALRVLGEVDLIAAEDTRRTARLLAHFDIATRTTSLHEHNEHQKVRMLIDVLTDGQDVALVSDAGIPTVSDPGAHVIREAVAAGVPVVAVPGASAIMTALASSGFEASAFRFLGFAPHRSSDRKQWLASAAADPTTLVFFESPHRIQETLRDALAVWGDREALLARELTKLHEQLVRGPISTLLLACKDPRGEYTIVAKGASGSSLSSGPMSDEQLTAEFGQLTESRRLSRRAAIAEVAKRHGLTANAVYKRLERAK